MRKQPYRRGRASRRGYTLIEVMIVVAIVGLILSSTATMMHAMFRAEQKTRREIAFTATFARLSDRFRQDAHAATKVDVQPSDDQSGGQIRLTMADGESIEYTMQQEQLRRVKRRQQKILHRDSFRLPNGTTIQFEIANEGARPLATIVVGRHFEAGASSTWRVQAVVGLESLRVEGGSDENE